jgi:FtsZ-interacting cell division protein ZipA
MKAKKSCKVLTLVLAVLLGVAMTPCVLHAQSQSTATSTNSTKAAKKKAKKEAKKARAEQKKANAEQEKANQATASATDSSSKADKRKAAREAKKARAEQEKASAEQEKASKAAVANTSATAAPAAPSANEAAARRGRTRPVATTQPATPPSAGMVWVNTETKVYHKAGSRWYGKTKSGKWMTEAEAQRAGYKLAKR